MVGCLCAQGDSNSHGGNPHKALNLARLPIPPQARVRSPIIGTAPRSAIGLDAVRTPFYCVRTHVRLSHNRAGCQVVDLKLTKRQQEIFDFIKQYSSRHGYPPTVRDIGKAIGLTSSSTVHAHLANLEKLGLVRRDPTKPRALELLGEAARKITRPAGLPVVGRVAAGSPILAEENIEDYVEVPPIAGGEDGEYVLRVTGDSMIDAGILDGDYVIVHRQETADNGEIVVALVGEEATVKRYFREADHIRLQPENPTMEPIRTRDVAVLGKVVGVWRRVS